MKLKPMMQLAEEVAQRYGITVADIRGPSRLRRFVYPRQELCALAYHPGRRSTTWIGRWLGGRDHSTVVHAINAYKNRTLETPTTDPEYGRSWR